MGQTSLCRSPSSFPGPYDFALLSIRAQNGLQFEDVICGRRFGLVLGGFRLIQGAKSACFAYSGFQFVRAKKKEEVLFN